MAAGLALLAAPAAGHATTIWTCRVHALPASQDPHWYRPQEDAVFRVDGHRVFVRRYLSTEWDDLCIGRAAVRTLRCAVGRAGFSVVQRSAVSRDRLTSRLDFATGRFEIRRGRALSVQGVCAARPG